MLGVTFENSDRPYEFSLTLPGTIVETNGTLESDSPRPLVVQARGGVRVRLHDAVPVDRAESRRATRGPWRGPGHDARRDAQVRRPRGRSRTKCSRWSTGRFARRARLRWWPTGRRWRRGKTRTLTTTMERLALLLALPAPPAAMTAATPIAAITGPAGIGDRAATDRARRHALDVAHRRPRWWSGPRRGSSKWAGGSRHRTRRRSRPRRRTRCRSTRRRSIAASGSTPPG